MDTFKEPINRIKSWWSQNKKQCENKALRIPKVGELVSYMRENMVVLSGLKSKHRNKAL
jgi:DUF1009 family protein